MNRISRSWEWGRWWGCAWVCLWGSELEGGERRETTSICYFLHPVYKTISHQPDKDD